jgi:protein SCO1
MKIENFRKPALIGVWTAFLLIVLWIAWMLRLHLSQPDLANAILYPPAARALPEFSLLDTDNMVFDKNRLAGKWSFLFFGYTRCPDICPLTLQTMQWTADRIRQNGEGDNLRFVFISVDPARDNLGYLKEYVSYFNPEFLGVAGDEAQLSILTAGMDAPYRRIEAESARADSYLMDHSAMIFLISPRAELYAMLPPPHNAETIAADFHTILAHFSKTTVSAMQPESGPEEVLLAYVYPVSPGIHGQ